MKENTNIETMVNELEKIEQQGKCVLTTAQLAECYGTESKILSRNFERNKERYMEGKHFIKLEGNDLKTFFANVNLTIANQNKIRTLYLWTERGALLHAKSLNTNKDGVTNGYPIETIKMWHMIDHLHKFIFGFASYTLSLFANLNQLRAETYIMEV